MENYSQISTTNINYYDPINKTESILKINKMPLNRIRLSTIQTYENDKDLENILRNILKDLNISKLVDGILRFTVESPRYQSMLSEYIYYLEKFNNHLKWNEYIDRLLATHTLNINFQKNYTPPVKGTINKTKSKVNNNNKAKNQFYRRETFDLFNEEKIYEYINPKTGEIIKSDNPNLCDKLNEELHKNKKHTTRKNKSEQKEKIKINRSPDFTKLKFKF